ncbi:MAG: GHKL domain-containing protein [Erysipelotrichaceae bacterium]|nr:GHKL domain-containing protein [Erysipelotrichaceae bacterium]
MSDILLFACLFISLPFFKNYLAKLKEYTIFHVAIHIVLILIYLSYLMTVFEKGELPIESSIEIVLITLLVYLIYQMMNKVIIIEKENYLIKLHNQELQFNQTNYDNLKMSIHEVKSLKHDMNHMLLSLIEDYNHQDYDKMYQSLVTKLNLINDTSTIIDTGNYSLDLIIASRMSKLQKENIEFISNTFDNQIHIDKIDFYTLLGNLLDNAIENCTSQSIKKVLLDIYEENDHLIIELKNTCTHNPLISNSSLDTTKKDVSSHGFGIDTIERIVQKYNGKITYDYSYHYFMVTLNLENKL